MERINPLNPNHIQLPDEFELEHRLNEPGHPVLLIMKIETNILNPAEHHIPVAHGESHSADEAFITLNINNDHQTQYERGDYTVLTGPSLLGALEAFCTLADDANPYQRANAVAFSHTASQLGLREPELDTATSVSDWIRQRAASIDEPQGRALAYAFYDAEQAQLYDQTMRSVLRQHASLFTFLKTPLVRGYLKVAGGDSDMESEIEKEIAGLARLLNN